MILSRELKRLMPDPVKHRLRAMRDRLRPPATAPPGSSDAAECPVCGAVVQGFLPFKGQLDRRCPRCGSLERHRLVWHYLEQRTSILTARLTVLHVAPEAHLRRRLVDLPNLEYLTADLDQKRAMVQMDITDIQYPDGSFDVVLATDVLEHIPDDERAMRERLFGQHDHVRMYGRDGEYARRLRRSGFELTVSPYARELGSATARRFRLRDEDVYQLEECRFVAEPGPTPLEVIYRDLADGERIYTADLDQLVCPFLPICDPVIGGVIARFDNQHVTPAFAVALADELVDYLRDSGVLRQGELP